MGYLFTSESVSEGHPDKVADQISDAVLDKLLAYDPSSKVACETLVTTGQVVLAGEIKTKAYVDLQRIAREVINHIGYTKSEYMFEGNSCGVLSAIHEQSPDINRGVEREDPMEQGAGDQGMMFGYATNETENYMPLSLDLAHKILMVLADIRREGKVMTYLRPDAKSQGSSAPPTTRPKPNCAPTPRCWPRYARMLSTSSCRASSRAFITRMCWRCSTTASPTT